MMAAGLAVLLIIAPMARALQNNAGVTAADFLSLGAGARSLGMGEAYSAAAQGPDAAYWNPAGLAELARPEVSYTRSELTAGIHHDFAAVAAPAPFLGGVLAFAFTRLSQESLDLVNNANQNVGSFSPHSEVYALAYGHDFAADSGRISRDDYGDNGDTPSAYQHLSEGNEVSAGLSLKAVNENLGTRQASAFAADGGVTLRPSGLHELITAFAFRDIGGKLKFISEAEPLPAELAAAAAYDVRLESWRLLPAFEADVPYAGNPYGKLGFEASYKLARGLWAAGRLGYSSRTVPDLGALSGLTAGVGLRIHGFTFDAAFQPMALLGESLRLSLGWRF